MAENSKKKRKKAGARQKKRLLFGLFALVFALILAWAGYAASYLYPLFWGGLSGNESADPAMKEIWETGQFTILLIGSDRREGESNSRSDTMMVAYVDLNTKTVRLLSIPRDTLVSIPETAEETKVNHAYAYGGVGLSIQTLAENFDIAVDYYVDIDFQGFSEVIDAIGGVTFEVPKRMYYPAEGIDLNAGLQTLNGDESLQFVRYRSDALGDLGRIERQQDFMEALLEQMMQVNNVLKIPTLSRAILENVSTDLTGAEIVELLSTLDEGTTMETYMPPGTAEYLDGISYYLIDETEAETFFATINQFQSPSE